MKIMKGADINEIIKNIILFYKDIKKVYMNQ